MTALMHSRGEAVDRDSCVYDVDVHTWIVRYALHHHDVPTIREIGEAFGETDCWTRRRLSRLIAGGKVRYLRIEHPRFGAPHWCYGVEPLDLPRDWER